MILKKKAFSTASNIVTCPMHMKVELLTPSGQRLLLLTTPVILQLDGGACEERIISHEVKELGEHRSVVTCSKQVCNYVTSCLRCVHYLHSASFAQQPTLCIHLVKSYFSESSSSLVYVATIHS